MGNNVVCNTNGYEGIDMREQQLLENVFAGLASRSPGRTMDKKTFLDYVEFQGMFGERLFDAFDTKKNKLIDLDEFMTGIARFLNGSNHHKIHLLFQMFDLHQNDQVTLEELRTMLYSMLQHRELYTTVTPNISQGPSTRTSRAPTAESPTGREGKSGTEESSKSSKSAKPKAQHDGKFHLEVDPKKEAKQGEKPISSPAKPKEFIEAEKVDEFVKAAHNDEEDFSTEVAENLIDHTLKNYARGKDYLTFDEFTEWIKGTPQILSFMEFQLRSHVFKKAENSYKSGYLCKRGKTFGAMLQRYCVVQDGFLYMFHTNKEAETDKPGNAMFLRGLRVKDPVSKDDIAHHGILLESDDGGRVFFARNAKEKQTWLTWLAEECKHAFIHDEYEIKEKIGEGRFANVFRSVHKHTGKEYAVKVMDKRQIDDADKEGLRAEIAILRLASHPFIVSMKKVFETKDNIYIVMEWLEHGDLFKEIIRKKSMTEDVARHIVQQLCSAIRYCHLRGIVHKDIKPENILVERLDDPYIRIYLTDFGLSQFAKPSEEMKDAAGSVAYMAPEMIDNDSFTKSVDIWGIGVIAYVMISGSLPFFNQDEIELMDMIVKQPVEFKSKRWEGISEDAKDFIRKMLEKNPKRRLTVQQAMIHPWLQKVDFVVPLIRKKSHQKMTINEEETESKQGDSKEPEGKK